MKRSLRATAWRQELGARIEDVLDAALVDVIPDLTDAEAALSFAPERLEAVLDIDAQVTSCACAWLELLDDDACEAMSSVVRRAVDAAAFQSVEPIVLRLRETGEGELAVPQILAAGLLRSLEKAVAALPSEAELAIDFDKRGVLTVHAPAPMRDPLSALFLELCGATSDDADSFTIDLRDFDATSVD